MELKVTESINAYFYMKSVIFSFQANNALQEKSIHIKLRDTTRPRLVGCVESGLHERIEGMNLGLQFGGILSL